MPIQIKIPREALDAFCRSWKITELAFFGSVLRKDFGEQSDIDILVTFAPDATPSLFDMVTMEDELATHFWPFRGSRESARGGKQPECHPSTDYSGLCGGCLCGVRCSVTTYIFKISLIL